MAEITVYTPTGPDPEPTTSAGGFSTMAVGGGIIGPLPSLGQNPWNLNPALQAIDAVLTGRLSEETIGGIRGLVESLTVSTYAEAEETEVGPEIDLISLQGFHTPGDLGAARYARVAPEPSHAGKVQTADGAWWEIAEPTLRLEMFGARPVPFAQRNISVISEQYDCTAAFNQASATAKSLGSSLLISEGRWAHSATLNWYAGVNYVGVPAGDNWRPANTLAAVSVPAEKFNEMKGSIFIAYGTFTKNRTLASITSNSQNGYGRAIPPGSRTYNNAFDARIDLWDGTEKNATGATPATLKAFSVAHYFNGSDLTRFGISGISFAVNCPLPGEGFGLGGYSIQNAVVPWADVDFGVLCESPWRGRFNFNVLGYTNQAGVFINSQVDGTISRSYAEHNLFEDCLIQGGVKIRTPDSWPILSKTSSSVTVRWTSSHQFAPTGSLRIGQSAFSFTTYNYTSVTYSPDSGGLLTFNLSGDTGSIVASGSGKDHVWLGTGAGYALTTFRDCEFYDFSHSTLIDEVSPELAPRARPYSSLLEISGYVRAPKFDNCIGHALGPVTMLLGNVNDMEVTSCWFEGRNGRVAISDSGYREKGSVIIAGPESAMSSEVGAAGIGTVRIDEARNLWPGINRAPFRPASSGYRMSSMTDLIGLTWRDMHEETRPRDTTDLALWATPSQELDFRGRDSSSTLLRALRTFRSSGSVGLGDNGSSGSKLLIPGPAGSDTIIEARDTFAPSSSSYNLGTSTRRWGTVYAVTGTINTSDEREKEQIRELEEAERAVAREVTGLVRAFKWRSAVDEKGDQARTHVGVIAQEVQDLFQRHGLDAFDYGILCYDEWDETPEEVDEEGVVIREQTPAGNRFGIRYDELMMFALAGLA